MQSSRWSHAGLLCAAVLFGSSSAYGQTTQEKAEALFNKAVELRESRKYDEACPLLAESQTLDPMPGTLFALADCEREANEMASSVAHFKEYLALYEVMKPDVRKRHDQRATTAREHVRVLEPKVPTLMLTYPTGAPEGLLITRNGVKVEHTSLGVAMPVDPGEQVIVVKVPGRRDAERRIVLGLGDKKLVALEAGASMERETPAIVPAKPVSISGPNARRVAGIVLVGAGAAGVVLGGVMGGLAVGQKGVVDEHCNGLDCDRVGLEAVQFGRTLGNASTVGFAAGGAFVAVGTVLLVTAPKSKPQNGSMLRFGGALGVGTAFLHVEGEFR